MAEWDISKSAAGRAEAWARESGAYFTSASWAHVLGGLGCSSYQVWCDSTGSGGLLPVFRKGPFRAGFLGFPVGMPGLDALTDQREREAAHLLGGRLGLDVVRASRSDVVVNESGGLALPDVWLDELQSWSAASNKRLKRDLAYAQRAAQGMRLSSVPPSPSEFHSLYADTVRAHRGSVRYTPGYFARLFEASLAGAPIKVVVAQGPAGELVGASVLAIDRGVGYYLHSAVSPLARGLGVSDLLLNELVDLAKRFGATRFNFMASPATQPGLVRFKQKWGGRRSLVVTKDHGVSLVGRIVVSALGVIGKWRAGRAE